MKTVAEIIDLVEEYGIACRYSKPDWHGKLAEIEAAIKKREARHRPLTDEQIEAGREATFSINNPFCPCDRKTMQKAVRWAEQKHGIGKQS